MLNKKKGTLRRCLDINVQSQSLKERLKFMFHLVLSMQCSTAIEDFQVLSMKRRRLVSFIRRNTVRIVTSLQHTIICLLIFLNQKLSLSFSVSKIPPNYVRFICVPNVSWWLHGNC